MHSYLFFFYREWTRKWPGMGMRSKLWLCQDKCWIHDLELQVLNKFCTLVSCLPLWMEILNHSPEKQESSMIWMMGNLKVLEDHLLVFLSVNLGPATSQNLKSCGHQNLICWKVLEGWRCPELVGMLQTEGTERTLLHLLCINFSWMSL